MPTTYLLFQNYSCKIGHLLFLQLCWHNRRRPTEKTGHVGTKYTMLLSETWPFTGIYYFHSVTCVTMVDKFWTNSEIFTAIQWWIKKLWLKKLWKIGQILCAHMPYFHRPSHTHRSEECRCFLESSHEFNYLRMNEITSTISINNLNLEYIVLDKIGFI